MRCQHFVVAAVALASCHDEESPTTTYFATNSRAVRDAVVKHAGLNYSSSAAIDPTAPESERDGTYLRMSWFADDGNRPLIGVFDVRLQGKPEPGTNYAPCRIHIGPAPVRRPFPVDFLFDLFEDRELGARIKHTIGFVPIDKQYDIEYFIEGFRVHLEQFMLGASPFVELVIDGCNRVPSTQAPYRFVFEDPIVFDDMKRTQN